MLSVILNRFNEEKQRQIFGVPKILGDLRTETDFKRTLVRGQILGDPYRTETDFRIRKKSETISEFKLYCRFLFGYGFGSVYFMYRKIIIQ
jgi:hypothetical protein